MIVSLCTGYSIPPYTALPQILLSWFRKKKYYVLLSRDQKVINFYKKKFNAKKTNTNFIYNSNINKNFLIIQELKTRRYLF